MTHKRTLRIKTTADYHGQKLMPSYAFVFSSDISDWMVSNCVQAVAKAKYRAKKNAV